MSEKSGGPSVGLLLLIPAAAVVVHAAMRHHRMMWEEIGDPGSATPSRWHGHQRRFAAPDADGVVRETFRLPPRIEWMLNSWHTRAHQASEPTEPPKA